NKKNTAKISPINQTKKINQELYHELIESTAKLGEEAAIETAIENSTLTNTNEKALNLPYLTTTTLTTTTTSTITTTVAQQVALVVGHGTVITKPFYDKEICKKICIFGDREEEIEKLFSFLNNLPKGELRDLISSRNINYEFRQSIGNNVKIDAEV